MDPEACLDEIRLIVERHHSGEILPSFGDYATALGRTIDLIEALDGWLSKGGFLPRAWAEHTGKGEWINPSRSYTKWPED